MTYQAAIEFLFNSLPVFQREGASAYKPGLGTSIALDDIFGNPHRKYATIHIAGTNGKGSTAHTLAAVLARAGYRTGLYTSPHIFDFRERIRVNGEKISEEAVVDFVTRWKGMDSALTPSFFELTSTMAFEYFADQNVDVAVIETGLGGRLDSTNIISPVLSIITNISHDHTNLLGDTLEKIAFEKAGIIKSGVPVVIGEVLPETEPVFRAKAEEVKAPIHIAAPVEAVIEDGGSILYPSTPFGAVKGELSGACQVKNTATILCALLRLRELGFNIQDEAVGTGFANVCEDTGLMGRWTVLRNKPLTVCDTGHNIGGWEYIASQLSSRKEGRVHLIVGFVNDKDISAILAKIASIGVDKRLYFSSPSVPRGLKAEALSCKAAEFGMEGEVIDDVNLALAKATAEASDNDLILIAGSNFLIADLKLEA
ncbi:folylpolyglutamate synthase/dihydrofolate synthase family protein [uncultured Duncaniella sp.]|uniref:bifunctional folylpolyglutamate synthase/dihydrofolate synthase n=1 Tax=uncultured Duncaniella sp. TaxID=2768039 RepID=UPI0025FCE258|nr:folylpolyglutamate synthase/dihydrofolate synthase family protein [uncultured Duncaniella sp.]